jgi:hypothetical protein
VLNGHLFKLEPANGPKYNRCKWAPQMASHILCDCEALATLKLRQLGQIFMKLDDCEDISVSRILHIVESMVLLNT